MGCCRVGDFADVAEAGCFEMVEQRLQVFPARLVNCGWPTLVNPLPRIDKRAQQPRPNGTVMIPVTLMNATLIARRVAGFAGREGAQAQRRLKVING